MHQMCSTNAKVLSGLLVAASCALAQYTISARPGAVNYIEGTVLLDGQLLSSSNLKTTFLSAGSLLETQSGKVEILLAPGMFLRAADGSQIRMLKPSLLGTQVAVEAGEAMLEVDQFVKEANPVISVRGATVQIQKTGLYRFIATGEASVTVIDGKAQVAFGEKREELGKGREVLLSDDLKTRKFDKTSEDELFAWSNVRAQYNASMSYQAARSVYNNSQSSLVGYNGYGYPGYSGFYGSGWLWNSGFNSWCWMPGNAAFFSPFGWGFYGPGVVAYAPVVVVPTGVKGGTLATIPVIHPHPGPGNGIAGVPVPVNASRLPALGFRGGSLANYEAARNQAVREIHQNGGLRTSSGAQPMSFNSRMANSSGGAVPAAASSVGHGSAGTASNSGGGHWSGGGASNSGGGAASHSSAGASGNAGGGHSSK